MAEEARQTFMCAFCSKSFSYQSGLSRHTKKEHPMQKEIKIILFVAFVLPSEYTLSIYVHFITISHEYTLSSEYSLPLYVFHFINI